MVSLPSHHDFTPVKPPNHWENDLSKIQNWIFAKWKKLWQPRPWFLNRAQSHPRVPQENHRFAVSYCKCLRETQQQQSDTTQATAVLSFGPVLMEWIELLGMSLVLEQCKKKIAETSKTWWTEEAGEPMTHRTSSSPLPWTEPVLAHLPSLTSLPAMPFLPPQSYSTTK